MLTQQEPWLFLHPLFDCLADRGKPGTVWSAFAESFFPLIYSVPAFLGVTLARSDALSRNSLEEIWAEELGLGEVPSHPALFERFHKFATNKWGQFPILHPYGIAAGREMVALCASGSWPIGVAAMLAHESQFPTAYSKILSRAKFDLGSNSEFFEVHSLADVEHTSKGVELLNDAVRREIVTVNMIQAAYDESTSILRTLASKAQEAMK